MSYFQYTGQDVAKQRAAGIVETRREIGEALYALVDDTARKMDDETCDRQFLLEDLLGRLAQFAENSAPGTEKLFAEAAQFLTHRPAYPLLIESDDSIHDWKC